MGEKAHYSLEVHVIMKFLVLTEAVPTDVDQNDDAGEEHNPKDGQRNGHHHFRRIIHDFYGQTTET